MDKILIIFLYIALIFVMYIDINKKPIIRTALNFAFSQLEKEELLNLKNIEKFQTIKNIKIENNKIVVEK